MPNSITDKPGKPANIISQFVRTTQNGPVLITWVMRGKDKLCVKRPWPTPTTSEVLYTYHEDTYLIGWVTAYEPLPAAPVA